VAVNWGARKFSLPLRGAGGPSSGSRFKKKDTMLRDPKYPKFDDPSLSLRSKYATLSPQFLPSMMGPAAMGAAAAMRPTQQPAFARNDSSGFVIPAFYTYPSRTELYSPLGSASSRLEGVTWNSNPLATATAAAREASASGSGGAEFNPSAGSAPSGAVQLPAVQTNNADVSTRGWKSVAAAITTQTF
jgi:hypothetical protein